MGEQPSDVSATPDPKDVRKRIAKICDELKALLLAKNAAYGNSALEPVRIFSRSSPEEALLVRIDDKLSRLMRGHEFAGDDTVRDLAGYLLLLLVYRSTDEEAKP
jgi:hypothetical protein